MTLLQGDSLQVLKDINDNSIDLIVTDPPYGIEFMGKDWDKALPSIDIWKECYRVLKTGKLAFVMCSPRQDVLSRMIISLEDAGFRTNYTSIYWTYASGFPKAANVSKLIDKRSGADLSEFGKLIEKRRIELGLTKTQLGEYFKTNVDRINHGGCVTNWENGLNLPTLEQYNKLIDVLKLDRQKLEKVEREIIGKGQCGDPAAWYAGNQSKFLEYDITKPATEEAKKMEGAYVGFQPKPALEIVLILSKGKTLTWLDNVRIPDGDGTSRFPANMLVSDNVLGDYSKYFSLEKWSETFPFLIVPKASKSEKNQGCEKLPKQEMYKGDNSWNSLECFASHPNPVKHGGPRQNNHPTVKPLKLFSYLITMGSRENDIILDPFCGSGTTLIAADNLSRKYIGIEINKDYLEIAKHRLLPHVYQTKLVPLISEESG